MSAHPPWTRREIDAIRRMAAAGDSSAVIGKALGRTYGAVRKQTQKYAIELCRSNGGRKPKTSPTDELEIIAWWKARHALGTNKSMAAKKGISESSLVSILKRHRLTEDMAVRRASREFQEQLANLPY